MNPVPLWPDGLPDNAIRHAEPEETVNRDVDRNDAGLNRAISSVSEPALFVHWADPDTATGDCVLVCPGGGYHHVTIDKEGHDVADWLNGLGISAVVLKYRTRPDGHPRTKNPADPVLAAILEDSRQALRLTRSLAAGDGVTIDRLGMMGFSAGAHLAVRIAQTADTPDTRPDFLALLYTSVPPGAADAVTAAWPPAFIAHAGDDTTTPVDAVLDLYRGYQHNGVPAEMHVYPEGGHAFGLGVRGGPVAEWTGRFARWVADTRQVVA